MVKTSGKHEQTLRVEEPLWTPASRTLRHRVHCLLRHGTRRIVLDLSAIPRIDAAGIGELIRMFNMATGADGALRVINSPARVREILERAQLFELLCGERNVERRLGVVAS